MPPQPTALIAADRATISHVSPSGNLHVQRSASRIQTPSQPSQSALTRARWPEPGFRAGGRPSHRQAPARAGRSTRAARLGEGSQCERRGHRDRECAAVRALFHQRRTRAPSPSAARVASLLVCGLITAKFDALTDPFVDITQLRSLVSLVFDVATLKSAVCEGRVGREDSEPV